MILDTKQSDVKHASAKGQRVILPRLMDSIWRILEMLASGLADGEALDLFVLDFQEAFWQVPLSPAERRFSVLPCFLEVCVSSWRILGRRKVAEGLLTLGPESPLLS